MLLRRGSKNNVLAGLFLLASLVLALGVFFLLSSMWERLTVKTVRYVVSFTLADGAEGLDTDAPVKVGGEKVGRVSSWKFRNDEKSGHIVGVDVEIEVQAEIAFYENAIANLMLPLLGSSSAINFPSVGDPATVTTSQGTSARLEPGERIQGRLAPPAFLSQAGYGPEQTKQVQSIISNAEETAARFNRISQRVELELDPLLSHANEVMKNTTAISSDARESFALWRTSILATLDRLKVAADRIVSVMESAQLGVDETRGVVASLQSTVDTNKDKISRTLDNIEELTEKIKTDAYAGVMAMLENGKVGTEEFARTAERLRVLVGSRATDLETTIANARLASDQLKLTMIEVRQAPWKILASPKGRKELENEVLYDSVRAYATAVSDLRAASASLESMTSGSGKPTDLDRRTIEDITTAIKASFERYQKAEQDFLKKWSGE